MFFLDIVLVVVIILIFSSDPETINSLELIEKEIKTFRFSCDNNLGDYYNEHFIILQIRNIR